MIIVVLNGVGGSGKDKFIKIFSDIYKNKVLNISTVDQVKNISKTVFGWDGVKDDKSRKLLSELKRVWTEYNNGPFNYTINKIEGFELLNKSGGVVFIHCREPEEIEKFKNFFKGYDFNTVLLERDVPIPDNESDSNVFDYDYDYYIKNDGDLEILKKKIKKFCKELLNK